MDKKTKTLLYFFLVLIILSIIATYYRTIVSQNYEIIEDEEVVDELTDE